jgi:hypothetical protein
MAIGMTGWHVAATGGYHNEETHMLETIADGLWTTTRPQRFFGIECGTRMNVVRLSDGALFVHSPVGLDPALRAAVDALGPVKAMVAPSLFHNLYAAQWKAAYPSAVLCCCPGLEKRRPNVPWDRVLGDAPEPEWRGDLDQVFFGARTMENEVVFFHRASRSIVLCDAVFNLYTHPSLLTRISAFLMGATEPGATWLEHVMIRRRAEARAQVDRMLAWNAERIVLAHGDLVTSNATEVLRRAYAWL